MALDAGADDLVIKPCDPFELRVRITVAERVLAISTELASSQSAARYYATHDALTGIWNRETFLSMFFRETDRTQRSKEPLALMLFDLDGLGEIKSREGILAEDRIVQQVVERLQRFLRSYDILGRYGEGEFLIALPGLRQQDTEKLMERMRRSIFAKPFRTQFADVWLDANFGVVQSKGHSPLIVLHDAERELAMVRMQRRNSASSKKNNNNLQQPEESTERYRSRPITDRVQ
jgi:diguanylate cyclase (GGDEF)-like protein